MTSKDDVDAQSAGTGPAVVAQVADLKPQTGAAPARLVMTDGDVKEIENAGNIISHLNAGNIVIDPALAEKAAKKHAGPPMTIAEAFERGDFLAAARMIEAQIARALNGDVEGGRYEDMARYARLEEKERAVREREAQLAQFYDTQGGYRDRHGGYFNANEGTYTDEKGGVLDNWGGYTYNDGSYKSKVGDYYDKPTNTLHLANGEKVDVKDTPPAQVVKIMRDNVEENHGYDPNFIKKAQAGAADADHPGKGSPIHQDAAIQARTATEQAAANQGAEHSAMAEHHLDGDSVRSKLAALKHSPAAGPSAPSHEVKPQSPVPGQGNGATAGSKFSASGGANKSADASGSSFFAVDSSISVSKFGTAPQESSVSAPDPVVAPGTIAVPRAPSKSMAP